jgi:hypothetical protein
MPRRESLVSFEAGQGAYTRTEPESSIEDAVCAIVYAAPRTELKELQVLREIITHKVRN